MSPNPVRQIQQVFFRRWPETEATVQACSWVHDHDYTGIDMGHYDVEISYRIPRPGQKENQSDPGDELFHGRFRRSGDRQIAPYHPGEQIAIRYRPRRPDRFRLASASQDYERLETILVMTLFALVAGYLLFTF